jgi:ABC-2 type transport system permease protein
MPTMMRIGFSEAVAYRAELLVWVLATTMPLVMLALWTAVARDAPVGRFGEKEFGGYFLSMFIVRQLTSAWAAWEMNYEVRSGALSMRLLRPVSPIFGYAIENLAALPMRLIVAVPVGAIALVWLGSDLLPKDPVLWLLWFPAILGAWAITFIFNILIGTLSLFMQSSTKVMDVWFTMFMLLSGYLFPLEILPRWARITLDFLPFRYQTSFPVELMNNLVDRRHALELLAGQWTWVAVTLGASILLWRAGLKRYGAYGG